MKALTYDEGTVFGKAANNPSILAETVSSRNNLT